MRNVVQINEDTCIGCTKCLAVCPTDAIIGASQQIHTVISQWCIGCQRCLPPCPVHCIEIVATPIERIDIKKRYQIRKNRLAQKAAQKKQADKALTTKVQSTIQAAIERAHAKKKIYWVSHE